MFAGYRVAEKTKIIKSNILIIFIHFFFNCKKICRKYNVLRLRDDRILVFVLIKYYSFI